MTTLRDAYVETLESENADLRERIAQLEAALGFRVECPLTLELTGQEGRLFGLLLKRDLVTKEAAMMALYGARAAGEEAEPKIVDVFICKTRRKLKPFGIEIATHCGRGWEIPAASKEIVRQMMGAQREAA